MLKNCLYNLYKKTSFKMWVKLTTPGEEKSKSKLNLKGRSQPDVYLWIKPHRGLVLLLFVSEVVIA